MRLDQFVSQACGLSRSSAQSCIRQHRVSVAGKRVSKPAFKVSQAAAVSLDEAVIQLPGKLYLMLHKPAGVISATHDAQHRTVLDLIDHPHRHTLHIVGRLDKDTTGLLLLTNDGAWSHQLMSPKKHVEKTYLATLAEPLTKDAAVQLLQGVQLHGEKQPSAAVAVESLVGKQARLTICEGKYHQVKRMFAAIGNRVEALHRERVGEFVLDEQLPVGTWRELFLS